MQLVFLHTGFSLGLAVILLIALRPAITEVVERAEINAARRILEFLLADATASSADGTLIPPDPARIARLIPDAVFAAGTAEELGLTPTSIAQARLIPGRPVPGFVLGDQASSIAAVGPGAEHYWSITLRIPEARAAVRNLYWLVSVALLTVYALVAAALELFVLPQNVYGPIRRMLDADVALRAGRIDQELVPESVIPADELGEIMRSRNESIAALRSHERALADALAQIELAATDLKRKNHLLEAAQRNLADADRLASLGMMSAGIAHELNTPLAVLKGLVEKLNQNPRAGVDPAQAALMVRVVHRLESLGESLLDFARVRPAATRPVALRSVVDEAVTLVRLDRDRCVADYVNRVPESCTVECDGDRMVQVLVNLLRNASDALRDRPDQAAEGRVIVDATREFKEGREWVSLTVADNGPGIDPDVLSRLFEPFASTRLDAHGTGLGLAVAEGIVREHGGLILARNNPDGTGAVFEIVLPCQAKPEADPDATVRAAGLDTV